MKSFRLRVAWREPHGVVRAPARDETIRAASLRDAVGVVLGHADALLTEGTNFAWLTDDQDNLAWTLRMDDDNADSIWEGRQARLPAQASHSGRWSRPIRSW